MGLPCVARNPGLTGYKQDKCRCATCRGANNANQRRRVRLIAYGRWNPLVDAEPARQHVRSLMAAGVGWQRVAKLAGVQSGTVGRILYGRQGQPPTKRIRPRVAEALMAIQAGPDALSDWHRIDAVGTRRRTQALAALGWSVTEQARRLGRQVRNHNHVLRDQRVTLATARAVAGLFDELFWQVPPDGPSKTRTVRWATRNDWHPPLAWDDIDDPAEQPRLDAEPPIDPLDEVKVARAVAGNSTWGNLTFAERAAAHQRMAARGMPHNTIARRLHVATSTLRDFLNQITSDDTEQAA